MRVDLGENLTERLTGTVIWSNQDTRRIVFDPDGGAEGKTAVFDVLGDYWTDATGGDHSGGYPDCLSARTADTVRTDPRRVELRAVYPKLEHMVGQIAVSVHCLE